MQRFYVPTWLPRIRAFIKDVETQINATDEDTLIIAHSFGGLVSKKALKAIKRNNIKLVTLATPHTASWLTKWGEVETAKRKLQIPRECERLCKTYGGQYDTVVFKEIATLPGVPQEVMKTIHQGFLWDEKIRKKIIEDFLVSLVQDF
ncbi:MAG TPA: alpha/beta hydrolase [Candidatus Gracilibacteria bacterium]